MKSILTSVCYFLSGVLLCSAASANSAGAAPAMASIITQTLPLQLSEAFERAWAGSVEVQRATLMVQASKLNIRAREAAFFMPRLDLGAQAGRQRSLGYGMVAASLPLDVTATLNGVAVDRATMIDIFNGVKAMPPGMIFYQNGILISLADLIASQAPAPDQESATSTSYSNSSQAGVSLSLGYSVYSAGADQRAIDSAKLRANLAEVELLAVKRRVALDGITAYVNLRQAWQQSEFDQEVLLREQGRRDARTKEFQIGTIAKNDLLRADLDYDLQRIKAAKSLLQREQTKQAYCEVVYQLDCVTPHQWPDPETMPAALNDVAQQWQASLFRKTISNRALQGLAVAEAESAYLPRINVNASVNMSGASNTRFQDSLSQFRYRGWQVGLSLSWNLFDGLQSKFGVAAAKLAQDSAELDLAGQLTNSRQEQAAKDKQVASLTREEARINERLARLKLDEALTLERLGRITKDELQVAERSHQLAQLVLKFQEWERLRAVWNEALLPCNSANLTPSGCTNVVAR